MAANRSLHAILRLGVACWIATLCSPLLAQEPSTDAPSTQSQAASTPAQPAFDLRIEAPDDVRELLEQHLELRRYRAIADLSASELDRLLVAAEKDTRDLVATLGYFSPEITFTQQTPNDASAVRRVTLSVVPGEPTMVADVRIDYAGEIVSDANAAPQRQQIQSVWSLPRGTRFTQEHWSDAKKQALRQITAQRYPLAQITTSLADVDAESHQAHLHLTLDSGPVFTLGGLVIQGLERYDAERVTRLVRLEPGATYDRAQLVAAQQRLTDSGYFDSAFVSLDTSGDPASAPVRVQVHEALRQKIVVGLGASTDGGARVSLEHTHRQLPLIGWHAVSKIMLDRESSTVGTELTSIPNEHRWAWIAAAQLQSQTIGSFDVYSQTLRGGRQQTGDPLDQSYYLQYDRADTASSNATTSAVAEVISANYAFTLRNFDNALFPTKGWGLGMALGAGVTLATQQYPYSRVVARGIGFQPLGGSAGRIAMRAEAGAVIARDGTNLPGTLLFLTGGDTSVRGYAYNELGVTLPGGLTTAGRYMGMGSVEWQRPIRRGGQLTQWESTMFVDAGAVADRSTDLQAKIGVGVGARWKSPVGPLQIDLAYGVATQRFRLHLNVGFNF